MSKADLQPSFGISVALMAPGSAGGDFRRKRFYMSPAIDDKKRLQDDGSRRRNASKVLTAGPVVE
jgi:hypothetical protein